MGTYDAFAPFYDAINGDRTDDIEYVRGLIASHHPRAETVLELACGTGSVLQGLQSQYEATGVDLAKRMLEIARRKLGEATRLHHGDMTTLTLDDRFDVVLCVYDSINHLLDFRQWQAVFDRACDHLEEDGVFIFDIHTERRLQEFVARPTLIRWLGDGSFVVIDVERDPRNAAVWTVDVFEHLSDSIYRRHSHEIAEISFPVERVRAALRRRFRRVRTYDAERGRPSARSSRLHFVCCR